MANFELVLNGEWKLKGFENGKGIESGAQKLGCDDREWFLGNVPGTVHTDLIDSKVIPDPFKDLNEKKVEWVAQKEWWYRKEFNLSPDFVKKRAIELVFEGLDTFATIWINGVQIGEAHNMFTPWRFNVTKLLQEGINLVAVRFRPVCAVATELQAKFGVKYGSLHADNFSARPYVRKAAYSFGWDWGPTLPTAGIWKTVKIVAYEHAKLGSVAFMPVEVSTKKAKVEAVAQVYSLEDFDAKIDFVIEGFGQRIEKEVNTRLVGGQNFVEAEFVLAEPQLWWPKGYGEPNLYIATVQLFIGEDLLDKQSVKCGIRSAGLIQTPDEEGKRFVFKINDLSVFCKGACWIPSDSFLPRTTPERYQKLLNLAAEANFNMLRVWGGGVYEDEIFYELCDKLGLMVWQDFMFANAGYPEDEWFLTEVEREAEEIVHRLRGHACIVVWCGNNEIQWQYTTLWKDMPRLYGLQIYDKLLPKILERLDGTRPYRQSTPFSDGIINSEHEGNRHNWIVWSQQADYHGYIEDDGRFLTEFGWQAPPSIKLLHEYLDPEDFELDSPAIVAHEKQDNGLRILNKMLTLHYPVPEDLEHFTLYAQLNQADALKTAVTHWRSRMFKTAGCLIWQLNDCWPVFSWSLIDYGLNPKPAYYTVKRACQPIIAPIIIENGKVKVYLVNETCNDLGLVLKFEVLMFNGGRLHEQLKHVTSSAYSSFLVLDAALDELPIQQGCILTSTVIGNGSVIFEDSRPLQEPKELKIPFAEIQLQAKKVTPLIFEVTLTSQVYAKAVKLDLGCLKGMFIDNFFDLLPNRPKTIRCMLETDVSLASFEEFLWWQSYPYQ